MADASYGTLAELTHGETADITGFANDFTHDDRYTELGFTPGTTVTLLCRALFGDPIVILVRGTRYALRRVDAAGILVKKLS